MPRLEFAGCREAYCCDITYVTAKEAGFDYLRDCQCYSTSEIVHRSFQYAIIDEADSIMIDEAKFPLVIAAKSDNPADEYGCIFEAVNSLIPKRDYSADELSRNVYLTEAGTAKVESDLNCKDLYDKRKRSGKTRGRFSCLDKDRCG